MVVHSGDHETLSQTVESSDRTLPGEADVVTWLTSRTKCFTTFTWVVSQSLCASTVRLLASVVLRFHFCAGWQAGRWYRQAGRESRNFHNLCRGSCLKFCGCFATAKADQALGPDMLWNVLKTVGEVLFQMCHGLCFTKGVF